MNSKESLKAMDSRFWNRNREENKMAENKWRLRAEDLKGTETEKNLLAAFAGESEARNKYTFFASKAKKEGFVQISNIFAETAANEK